MNLFPKIFVVVISSPLLTHAEFCCSKRFNECSFEPTDWCNSASTCERCNGLWMDSDSFDSTCAPRWAGCWQKTCCEPSTCIKNDEGRWRCTYVKPTPSPTLTLPTMGPSSMPSMGPSPSPSTDPSGLPTSPPTSAPSPSPSDGPSTSPSSGPSDSPSSKPSIAHSSQPSGVPSVKPTSGPSVSPSGRPSSLPSNGPTRSPVVAPTNVPSQPPIGPFVPADYSERIELPQLFEPNLESPRTSCPHLRSGLLDWHSATTWPSGSIPSGVGENVTLPQNSEIVVQQSILNKLGIVTIPASSSLIIGENAAGISVDAGGFDVQGKLRVGSETCRVEQPVTITLHGSRPSDAVSRPPPKVIKGISVTGALHLHGKRYFRTWTRLSQTVNPGDSKLYVQHEVNWDVGQEIVLITTAMKDSREWHQNEKFIISHLDPHPPSGVGAVVHLSTPVVHTHIANMGYQAEVGLLTRTVTVQGSLNDSLPTDPDPLNCQASYRRFGDRGSPCPYTEITGYGGHIIVHGNGIGFVEGVELLRMGQTNVMGRYPMHFHRLGDNCPGCYLRDSSIHQSFYRCISIHGTNAVTVAENVAFDVTGFCYYLEDGIETNNDLLFNLAAHIHLIGPEPPHGGGQHTKPSSHVQNDKLTLPADVSASAFYITNVHNNLIGNAASGGWAGFAFPILETPLQTYRYDDYVPAKATTLALDGNTAHSSGWWFGSAGAFYFGGKLFYRDDGMLEYIPGRSMGRNPCKDPSKSSKCDPAWLRMTNNKAFLTSGAGLNSWGGRMEIDRFESLDNGMSVEALSKGFWLNDLLAVCRTGELLAMPSDASPTEMEGNGFFWYDTAQEHIITNSTFRNCGYRSGEFDQYDSSPTRGCGNNIIEESGCKQGSTVFGFLTHSDEFNPELMQGTRNITFEDCGRRFYLRNYHGDDRPDSVSGRSQNWLDVDGSASGLGEPTLIGSGLASVNQWWTVDSNVIYEPQGPLRFIKKNDGPSRGLGHFKMTWDSSIHSQVGSTLCGNGDGTAPCDVMGYIRHAGPMFTDGIPVTAAGDIVGPVGGFGWIIDLNEGAPRTVKFELIEVLPDTPLLVTIPYPPGTTFTISANGASWCKNTTRYSCREEFTPASSIDEVRNGPGNQYYVDSSNAVTFRIVRIPHKFIGSPEWSIPDLNTPGKNGNGYAIERFERDGVLLPELSHGPHYLVEAHNCGGSGVYCSNSTTPSNYNRDVCDEGYHQVSYDMCAPL